MIKEDGTVAFDEAEQKEVDRIIQERVARVKAEKPADYEELQELSKTLEDFEAYAGLSTSEKKALLKQVADENKANKELAELEAQADEQGTSPALLKEINDAKKAAKAANDKLAAIEAKETAKTEAEKVAKMQEENYQIARKELLEAHDVDADDLQKDEDFMEYIEGKKNINLVKEYEKFIKLTGKTAAEATLKYKSKESRSTSSGKGGNSDGATHGLSDRQQELAKKNGMAYKEYAELLQNVQ